MSIIEYIFRKGRTEAITHPIIIEPEIVFPDTLSARDISLFIESNGSGYCVSTFNYMKESYIDPYSRLNTSYSRMSHIFYKESSYKGIETGYIEYTVELREHPDFINWCYSSTPTYRSKYLYAIVKDELLICVIDGNTIKTSTGDEYSLYKFDSIPTGLRRILITVITNHNTKIKKERIRISDVIDAYHSKVAKQKEQIQNILEGIE